MNDSFMKGNTSFAWGFLGKEPILFPDGDQSGCAALVLVDCGEKCSLFFSEQGGMFQSTIHTSPPLIENTSSV